jgi:hypothetical protein
MIKKVGKYFLTQKIDYAQGLKEFSEEEYFMAETFGMKRILEDEKMFNGISLEFASIPWETTTIGSTKGKIYKISLQLNSTSKKSAKEVLNTVVKFINKEIGRYNEHPFLSDKYIWDTAEGNIILHRTSKFNVHSVNIFFTSNIIREQISKLQKDNCSYF